MARATDPCDFPEAERIGTSAGTGRIGAIIAGTYRVTRHIGSGGSSHVFEAEHVRLGKLFALKLMRPELEAHRHAAQRFRREARAMARIKSEHVVSVIDCGELEDGTPYLLMELLEGQDLRRLLVREGPLPARRAVALIIEACRGLSEVHRAGLVHRDLKPENLFITRRSSGEDWCKVLDFGVAKMEASSATAQGAILGTLRYMAPEQLDASSAVGPASDIYALGAILYECLCGRPAHPGETAQEVMFSVMNRAVAEAPLHAAQIPPPLADAVTACLAKEQQRRPRDASELIDLLSSSCSSTASAPALRTVSEDDDAPQFDRRPTSRPTSLRRVAWTAGVTVLGVVTFLWWARQSTSATSRDESALSSSVGPRRAIPTIATSPQVQTPSTGAELLPAQPAPPQAPPPAAEPQVPAAATARYRPRPRATLTASSSPSATARVGNFDPTNPYGE